VNIIPSQRKPAGLFVVVLIIPDAGKILEVTAHQDLYALLCVFQRALALTAQAHATLELLQGLVQRQFAGFELFNDGLELRQALIQVHGLGGRFAARCVHSVYGCQQFSVSEICTGQQSGQTWVAAALKG
jgi:hypothetical protein